ncbi:hypothetical protein C8R46DRAFT_1209836 [Mycena filopes]|nr:hypothetical protein C8R46DRAFT_1209836 [Mycena filopes]
MPAPPSDDDQTLVTAERHHDDVGKEASVSGQISQTVSAGESPRSDTSFKHRGVAEATAVLFVGRLQHGVSAF